MSSSGSSIGRTIEGVRRGLRYHFRTDVVIEDDVKRVEDLLRKASGGKLSDEAKIELNRYKSLLVAHEGEHENTTEQALNTLEVLDSHQELRDLGFHLEAKNRSDSVELAALAVKAFINSDNALPKQKRGHGSDWELKIFTTIKNAATHNKYVYSSLIEALTNLKNV